MAPCRALGGARVIVYHNDLNLADALLDTSWRRVYLAEGDSWFSIGGLTGNLLMEIDEPDVLIVSCAYPGDTTDDIAALGNDAFAKLLDPQFTPVKWDAILLSGGGNDLLGRCAQFILPYGSPDTVGIAYDDVLDRIERNLLRVVNLCETIRPGVPVYAHTYDYPPVSRRWWWWQLGPWVSPVFRQAGIPRSAWDSIAAWFIDDFAICLEKIAEQYGQLHIIETRGRLLPREWRNEIHPTTRGYAELAKSWRKAINPQPKGQP